VPDAPVDDQVPDSLAAPFHDFLAAAGWDATTHLLTPAATHSTLGYRSCPVAECGRAAWGAMAEGLCVGCQPHWIRARDSGLKFEEFISTTPRRSSSYDPTQCSLVRADVRCGRVARTDGFCSAHDAQRRQLAPESFAARAVPLPRIGPCTVASCDRESVDPKRHLCRAHNSQFSRVSKEPRFDLEVWRRTAAPVSDSRRVVLRGLARRVAEQILYGVYLRHRRGSQTRLDMLQGFVDVVRTLELSDLRGLRDVQPPGAWATNTGKLGLWRIMLRAVEDTATPEQFRNADRWPGAAFGKAGEADFTVIPQPWLRDLARAWAWDNVNKYRDFGQIKDAANSLGDLGTYLFDRRADHGRTPALLGRDDVLGFAGHLRRAMHEGQERRGYVWTEGMVFHSLNQTRKVLRHCRDLGLMEGIPAAFTISDDIVPRRPRKPGVDEEPGDALPVEVLRLLFASDAQTLLVDLWDEAAPRLLRAHAETGRRPGEVASLPFDCLEEGTSGGPYLLYVETKVTDGELRRVMVTSSVVNLVRDQQKFVLDRFPDTPTSELKLFPRLLMNPHGYYAVSVDTYGTKMRAWVDALPPLVVRQEGQDVEFPKERVFPYAFRHTYAQRHADAGVQPDVLKELMGHDQIATTMGYYRVGAKRRREAVDLVGGMFVDSNGELIIDRSSGRAKRDLVGEVAVPYGKCREPHNVQAEGHDCPIRHKCFGCGFFDSDPSYLPEMRRYHADLKAQRARADAFAAAEDWARAAARPPDEEIAAVERAIRREEAKLAAATPEQRDAIERATVELRRARAAGTVGLTLRMGEPDGAIVVPAPGHQPIAELRVVVNDVTGELHRDLS
jgi:integrase